MAGMIANDTVDYANFSKTPTNEFHYPLIGYPTKYFWMIHTVAMCSTSISVVCSSSVVVMFIRKRIYGKIRLFERLLLYLSINDLFFSSFHGSDHALIMFSEKYPPRGLCIMFGFVLFLTLNMVFICSSLVSVGTAMAIVRQGRVSFGPKDCVFFGINVLPPLTGALLGIKLDWYGPSGAWCLIDLKREDYNLLTTLGTVGPILLCQAFNLASYFIIFLKIRSSRKAFSGGCRHGASRVSNIRLAFLGFMLSLFFLPMTIQGIWTYFESPPPPQLVVATVGMANTTGLVNACAFTVVPRLAHKLKHVRKERLNLNANVTAISETNL